METTIAPMLSLRNGRKALEFYRAAFRAEELFKIDNDGSVVATLSEWSTILGCRRIARTFKFQSGNAGRRNGSDGDGGERPGCGI
jgi:hypothetical protein